MAQTGKPRHGKNGRVDINGTTIKATTASIQSQTEWADTTNFETQGYAEGVFGIRQANVGLELYWDASQNPFDNPPNLKDGQILDNVKIWLNVADIKFFNFTKLAIVSVSLAIPTRGVITYSVQGVSDGPWTEVTGSV